jgi:hypothetical protein
MKFRAPFDAVSPLEVHLYQLLEHNLRSLHLVITRMGYE